MLITLLFSTLISREMEAIIEGDDVYRVFQSQDFAMYGRSSA